MSRSRPRARGSCRRARAAPSRPRLARQHPWRAHAQRLRRSSARVRSAEPGRRRTRPRATRGRPGSPPPHPRPCATESVSSMRRISTPASASAKRRLATAVSAFPRWSEPVGLGANRTRTFTRRRSRRARAARRPARARHGSRGTARGRSRLRVRRGCRRRARCRRSSSCRRRGSRGRPGAAPSRRAPRSPLHPSGKPIGEALRCPRVREPEPRDGDVRLVAVLLEELPLQHLRALVRVVRDVLRAVGEVPEDRVRLAERAPVVEDERRHAQRRDSGRRGAPCGSSGRRRRRRPSRTRSRAGRAGAEPCSSCPRPPSCRAAPAGRYR